MTDDLLNQSIAALKAGRKAEARALLAQLLQQDSGNEQAWLWLSGAVDNDEERRHCLERVLALNPGNEAARRGLARLSPGSLAPNAAPRGGPVASPVGTRQGEGRWATVAGVAMLAALCILLAALAAVSEARRIPTKGPLYDTPYIVVYGQQGDDLTQKMMNGLDRRGVPYTFKSTDDEKVRAKELLPRMKAADL